MTKEEAVDAAAETAAEAKATTHVAKVLHHMCLEHHQRHPLAILVTTMVKTMSKTMITAASTTREDVA